MYSNEHYIKTLRKLVFRPLQLMGIFPFYFDSRKVQFKNSKAWLAITITNVILLLTALPWSYYHVLIYIGDSGSSLSYMLVIVQLMLDYVVELSIYINICSHIRLLQATANDILELFLVLLTNVDQIDRMVFKRIVNKIYFMNISFCITAIVYIPLVTLADSFDYQLTIWWMLFLMSPYRFLTMTSFFICVMMIEATLYDSINQRITKSLKRLRQLDRNESYWTTHVARKKALCKAVADEIVRLCRLHRIVTKTMHKIGQIFSTPIMLIILKYCLFIISETFFFYTGIANNLRRGVYPNYEKYILSFIFVIIYTVSFYCIASSSYRLTSTAERTGVILNESIRGDVDERVEVRIEVFTLELLHQNYKIDMYGLFILDLRLFYEIFASITKYLIILVQFQLTDD